ncbi:MAG TPA: coproporphyrinogen III oxidase, partial [Leptospiraceae bacterium]|nr:coproporphyrinogen III oxidase [Leptospiraceae bacterium]
FYQNEKILKKYQRILHEDRLPSLRGHKLTEEDMVQRKLILDLTTTWKAEILSHQDSVKIELKTMEDDGLVRWEGSTLYITEAGRPFLRNACMALDLRLHRSRPDRKIFSQAI